ncbi:MAG TPA: sigma-70 family RNA polymerase sigma factor [Phycisphaerales bacterium]|nr:sigma-70 family RNA polymerase sigma factor [Phycisphaerales bacterium]
MFVGCMEDARVNVVAGAMPREGREDAARVMGQRWLTEYGDVLWRFCLARTRSVQVAEEMVQETLLAAMKNAGTFAGESSEQTWLLGIAANKIADFFRKQAREGARVASAKDGHGRGCACGGCAGEFASDGRWARIEPAWSMEEQAERSAMLSHLRGCLDELPPAQAKLVWLRELKGVPSDEVCKALGISATNMWTRMHRARAALRACLGRKLRSAHASEDGGA